MMKAGTVPNMTYWILLAGAMMPFLLLLAQAGLKRMLDIDVAMFDSRLFLISVACSVAIVVLRNVQSSGGA